MSRVTKEKRRRDDEYLSPDCGITRKYLLRHATVVRLFRDALLVSSSPRQTTLGRENQGSPGGLCSAEKSTLPIAREMVKFRPPALRENVGTRGNLLDSFTGISQPPATDCRTCSNNDHHKERNPWPPDKNCRIFWPPSRSAPSSRPCMPCVRMNRHWISFRMR